MQHCIMQTMPYNYIVEWTDELEKYMARSSLFVSELPHTSQVASHLLSPYKYINIRDYTPPGSKKNHVQKTR